MSWGALFNGFPLIFPDTGTYLAIAFGHEYAIDRSSFYGFLLKPVVGLGAGATGLWLAVSAQCLAIGAVIWCAARHVMPDLRAAHVLGFALLLAALTSLPCMLANSCPTR